GVRRRVVRDLSVVVMERFDALIACTPVVPLVPPLAPVPRVVVMAPPHAPVAPLRVTAPPLPPFLGWLVEKALPPVAEIAPSAVAALPIFAPALKLIVPPFVPEVFPLVALNPFA